VLASGPEVGNQQNIFGLVAGAVTEDLRKEDLNLDDIEDVTFLIAMASIHIYVQGTETNM